MILRQTPRTVVRPFLDRDLASLVRMMKDAEVMKFTGFKIPQPEARVVELLQKWKAEGEKPLGVWAIEATQTQELVAWFMLKATIGEDPELGFMIAKEYWNQGYATEVCREILQYAFDQLKINRVIACCTPENLASIRVLKKIGMTEYPETSGKPAVIYFQILRSN